MAAGVIDHEHTVVARKPYPERWVGQPSQARLVQAMAAKPEGFIETVSFDGVPVLAFYSRSLPLGIGNENVKVVPFPIALSTRIVPP